MYNETDNLTQVVEKLKNGDESAFATIYNQTYKYVYSRAKCMFSDEEEVQDLVQEVYLALYRNSANIQSSESIFGWLKTATFYHGTKILQKKRKEVLLSEESEELFETIPDDEPQIEENYMNKEDVVVIRECINRLSDEQKTVLLAYYYDNLKVDEIADMLDISVGTIKSRLYLARKNLQVHIETEEKKRGYKLHSVGTVTLALAIRAFLQTNMEAAGSAENVIFNQVCQNLNFQVAKQSGKGVLGKLEVIGAKKIAIAVVGMIAAAAIGTTAVVRLNRNNEDNGSKQASEYAQDVKELQQWQVDYAKILLELTCMPGEVINTSMADSLLSEELNKCLSEGHETIRNEARAYGIFFFFGLYDSDSDGTPELYVEFRDEEETYKNTYMFLPGNCIEECYIGKVDGDYSMEMHRVEQGDFDTVLEVLSVNVSHEDEVILHEIDYAYWEYLCFAQEVQEYGGFQYATFWFDEDEKIDYVFAKDGFITNANAVWNKNVNFANEYVAFLEKKEMIVEHKTTDDLERVCVYKAFDDGVCRQQYIMDKYVTNSSGTVEMEYQYIDYEYEYIDDDYVEKGAQWIEITEEEYLKMYNEYCGGEKNFYTELEYANVLELLNKIEFTLAK